MYATYIGHKFLDLYRRKTPDKDIDAVTFFETVMFPLFFENEKHLFHPFLNTPFTINVSKKVSENGLTIAQQQLKKLKEKAAAGDSDCSAILGGSASNMTKTTSGQITGMPIKLTEQDIFASWIGYAFTIKVEGAHGMLLENEDILWHIYNGWWAYREFCEPLAKAKQLETWNVFCFQE